MRYAVFAAALLFGSDPACSDAAPITQILTTNIHSESARVPPGSSRWQTRWVVFPEGCDYVSHEIELLDEFPEMPLSAHRLIADSVQRDKSGRAISMGVSIGAYRTLAMPEGRASITVKLSLTVSCEDGAVQEMRDKFATVDLDFD